METGFFDVVTDLMAQTAVDIKAEVNNMFKGQKPYGMVKKPDVDAIAEYMSMPPDMVQNLRLSMPETFGEYEQKMQKIIKRYSNG